MYQFRLKPIKNYSLIPPANEAIDLDVCIIVKFQYNKIVLSHSIRMNV